MNMKEEIGAQIVNMAYRRGLAGWKEYPLSPLNSRSHTVDILPTFFLASTVGGICRRLSERWGLIVPLDTVDVPYVPGFGNM